MPKEHPLEYLVTGANRGIGLAFARHLSERGESVIATARHPEKARELAKLSLRLGFIFVAICPGWVKTNMGGPGASVSPADSVAAMLKVIYRLAPSDTGRFLDRHGKDMPW